MFKLKYPSLFTLAITSLQVAAAIARDIPEHLGTTNVALRPADHLLREALNTVIHFVNKDGTNKYFQHI